MLARWTGVVQDDAGSAVVGASIEVRSETTGALVPVFGDRNGASALGNPFTTTDATFAFHARGGAYRVTARRGGFERVWRYVANGTAQEFDFDQVASTVTAGVYPAATLANLNAYVPGTGQALAGLVLNDPAPANNGYYIRVGSSWVRQRGLPDTLSMLQVTGGTANAVQAGGSPGVDPAMVAAFVLDVTTPNTGPVTLSVNGGAARPVLNAQGDQFAAGQFLGRMLLSNEGTVYRDIIRPGSKGDQGDEGPPGTTDYLELENRPTLGTAAAADADDFAPIARALPTGGVTGQVPTRTSDGGSVWSDAGTGDMRQTAYDTSGFRVDAFGGGLSAPTKAAAEADLHPVVAPGYIRTAGLEAPEDGRGTTWARWLSQLGPELVVNNDFQIAGFWSRNTAATILDPDGLRLSGSSASVPLPTTDQAGSVNLSGPAGRYRVELEISHFTAGNFAIQFRRAGATIQQTAFTENGAFSYEVDLAQPWDGVRASFGTGCNARLRRFSVRQILTEPGANSGALTLTTQGGTPAFYFPIPDEDGFLHASAFGPGIVGLRRAWARSKKIKLRSGETYEFNGPADALYSAGEDVDLRGEGATIHTTSTEHVIACGGGGHDHIQAVQSIVTDAGQTPSVTITVPNGLLYSRGDVLFIRSEQGLPNFSDRRRGEFFVVHDIGPTSVFAARPLRYSYGASNSANAVRIGKMRNVRVRIKDLRADYVGAKGETGQGAPLIYLESLLYPEVEDIETGYARGDVVQLRNCYGWRTSGTKTRYMENNDNAWDGIGTPYCVAVSNCAGGKASDGIYGNGRHGADLLCSSAIGPSQVKNGPSLVGAGGCYDNKVVDWYGEGGSNAPYSTHDGTEDNEFINCKAVGARNVGLQFRGSRNKAINCGVERTPIAFRSFVQGTYLDTAYSEGNEFIGCWAKDISSTMFEIQPGAVRYTRIEGARLILTDSGLVPLYVVDVRPERPQSLEIDGLEIIGYAGVNISRLSHIVRFGNVVEGRTAVCLLKNLSVLASTASDTGFVSAVRNDSPGTVALTVIGGVARTLTGNAISIPLTSGSGPFSPNSRVMNWAVGGAGYEIFYGSLGNLRNLMDL